jgi:hypothetical protein
MRRMSRARRGKIAETNDRRSTAELSGRGDPSHELCVATRTIGMS